MEAFLVARNKSSFTLSGEKAGGGDHCEGSRGEERGVYL